jgi:hypothetical protein
MLYRMTWKRWDTPSGRRLCRLVASARPTSGSGCFSWPTPQTSDASGGGQAKRALGPRSNLNDSAMLAGWPTPRSEERQQQNSRDAGMALSRAVTLTGWPTPRVGNGGTGSPKRADNRKARLEDTVFLAAWSTPRAADSDKGALEPSDRPGKVGHDLPTLAAWATPEARDWRSGRTSEATMNRKTGRPLNEQAVMLTTHGVTPSGSPAETGRRGQLNPAHSRWLMGLPVEWLWCAPRNRPEPRYKRKRTGTTGPAPSGGSATRSSRKSRRRS